DSTKCVIFYSSHRSYLPPCSALAKSSYNHCRMLCHTGVPLSSFHHLLQSHKKVRLVKPMRTEENGTSQAEYAMTSCQNSKAVDANNAVA
ncbi:Proline-rich membrane anchor 1, partial [Ophiophagus hannah]